LICRFCFPSSGLLFRTDIVTTFSGETLRNLRAVSLLAVGIFVWALLFAGCSGGTITITLEPASGLALNPGQTTTITAVLTNDTTNAGVTWILSGPGTLSGNTTTSVVYTAPTIISVSTTATITATSVANSTVTATESITLNSVLTITTTSLSAATLGVPYDAFVNAAGAPAPFTWSVISGTLPPGLSFETSSTSTSAEIIGTPTVLGTSSFSVQVTDSEDATVTQALSITVNKPPPLSVATGSLPDGTVNIPYSQTLQASSGVPPYTWSLAGGTLLPAGLTLDPTSGSITGTPIVTGTTNFTVEVKDSSTPTPQIANANLSITVEPGATDNSRLSGHYAFLVSGFNSNPPPALPLFVAAGSFVADGAGNISGGVMDINDTGSEPVNPSFTGTYSIGQNGLGFMTISISSGGSRTFALSMMANGNAKIIEFDDSTGGFGDGSARDSGVLLQQDTSAFSSAPVNATYAFGFSGIDSSLNRFGMAGVFQSDGAGHLTSGELDSDDAGTLSSSLPFTGSYTAVASTGRGTMTISTANGPAVYSFYVVNAAELLVMGIDTFAPGGNPLASGTVLQQSCSGCFSAASFNTPGGVFELTALDSSTTESQVGLFSGSGGGSFTLFSDQNTAGALTSPSGTGTYSVAPNGRMTLPTGSGFQNSLPVVYLVTVNEGFIVGTDTAVSFGFMAPQASFGLSGTYAGGSLAPVDPSISNVVSIALAGSGNLNVTADVSNGNGLSQSQVAESTTPPDAHGRVVVTENTNTTEILYLVSTTEFFALAADQTARVDIFQQ
jgi:large repetitive protein